MKPGAARLALALLLAGAATGCSDSVPRACPALAWFNSLTVFLDGAVEKVSQVELCADDVCSVRADGPASFPVTSVSPGAVPAPEATLPLSPATTLPVPRAPGTSSPASSPFTVSRVDDRTWTASLLMRSPKTVTVTAYGPDGSVLARRNVEPGWTRVGGSEACGGPVTAGPVRLVI